MGNCCSQGAAVVEQNVAEQKPVVWSYCRRQQSSDSSDAHSDYIAPELTDVFFKDLRKPVYIPTSQPNIVPRSSPLLSTDHNGETEYDEDASDDGCCADSVGRRFSECPMLMDLVLVRDLWRSRIITESNISAKYAVSPNLIGFGVCGSVRQIIEKKSQRSFALKSLKTFTASRRKLTSIFNEIAIYIQLDHPNIAFLHEVHEEVGVCHMVMEHCTGNELYDRLDNYKRFAENYTKQLTVQMLLALNYLHSNGICHRDLKLENWVFSTPDMGSPLKMIDFGFARLFEEGVPMGGMHGTVYYVDPEVIDGCYNEKCDVWSTGVIVYMLLSGSPPFNGDADRDILLKIKKGTLKFEGIRWSQVSETAKDFIRYLLNRNGTERASAIQALHHPWLHDEVAKFDNNTISVEMLRHIVEFSKKTPLHRAIVALCVLNGDRNLHPEIYQAFFSINTSSTGSITLAEFTTTMEQHLGLSEQEIANIFDTIAFRGTPYLHYTEFVTAVYENYTKVDINSLSQVYKKLDVFGNGRVDAQSFTACIGEYFSGTSVDSMLSEVELNQNGVIDFAKFCECIISVH